MSLAVDLLSSPSLEVVIAVCSTIESISYDVYIHDNNLLKKLINLIYFHNHHVRISYRIPYNFMYYNFFYYFAINYNIALQYY